MTPEAIARLERFNEIAREQHILRLERENERVAAGLTARTNKQVYVTPREWIELSQLALDLKLTHNGKGSVSKLMQAIAKGAVTIQ